MHSLPVEAEAPSMASNKRALLAKAATSKAAAWGTRATSKAPAMAPTSSKARGVLCFGALLCCAAGVRCKAGALVGATARRFQKGFSKAALKNLNFETF